ncbi:hypothetical protein P22_3531 [Propionispora sp. 2/2-37]|uniref:DEAD/DEAH box helicase family protein n=1 Tax=Propionispora sp. 2/2-37 TaxID=1677858 RepID=UPI0006BB800C|nr:DEAD/DEAH box helicase family protein [Propionispora sp. 2/2-37]CUH97402.1 hypothetical protein P22_3531 [Propionispora sp. 2/2-37]
MIKVVDSIMGSGKTNWAIQYMNKNSDKRFMYITPYNDEIKDRIIPDCPQLKFKFAREGHKVNDFKLMLEKGHNIVATHECFKRADEEVESLLEANDYILIMDEVFDVVLDIKLSKADVDCILARYAKVKDSCVIWTDETYPNSGSRYSDIKQYAQSGNLMVFNDTFFLWLFPVKFFQKFEEVYIMTYLFPAQIQRYYFDLHNIQYEYYTVTGDNATGYKLIKHDGKVSNNLKPLINIYEGKLNDIGKNSKSGNPLSKGWFKNNKPKINTLKNNVYNYFHNITQQQSNNTMWTTFKEFEHKIKPNGYARGFIECNARATNKYKDRTCIAYCVNRFMRTSLKNNYFELHNIKVDEDMWALSEMLQFLWRSAIREGKPIELYIPSQRMRELLIQYLDNDMQLDYSI